MPGPGKRQRWSARTHVFDYPGFPLRGMTGRAFQPVFLPRAHRPRIWHHTVSLPKPGAYSISSKILNIGRYMEITMPPTMPPTTTIIRGSMIEVSAFTAASTSDS